MSEAAATYNILPVGDRALLVEVGNEAGGATATRVRALLEHLLRRPLPGVRDVVPGICGVTLHYEPTAVDIKTGGSTPFAAMAEQVRASLGALDELELPPSRSVELPVCYGGEYGEDLDAVARAHGLSGDDVIALHSAPEYRVQVLGFAPGFAYMTGLDPGLTTPRRQTPRTRVPAGSVALGGDLTGVYPFELPGGWHLIGRSPVRLFDPTAQPPSLLQMGDRVRFLPITPEAFRRLKQDYRWR